MLSMNDPRTPYVSEFDGIAHYTIDRFDEMAPFFMSLVSGSDHWMFISSTGGLTAGRNVADRALFPYYTDDKIHDAYSTTGPVTWLRIFSDGQTTLWQPFAPILGGVPTGIERRLHKSMFGNSIVFEEYNPAIGLSFSYRWSFSERFGVVRTTRITNTTSTAVGVEVLDGLQNILPAGADRSTQDRASTLLDGYKRNELDPATGLGVYSLSSVITDRAEPSESLRANTVWSAGFPEGHIYIDPAAVTGIAQGISVDQLTEIRGRRGAYLLHGHFDIVNSVEWMIVAEVDQSSAETADLRRWIDATTIDDQIAAISADLEADTDALKKIVARGDGLQNSGDERMVGRHYSNVLFNVMRGGVFLDGYTISRDEFSRFVRQWNSAVHDRFGSMITDLPDQLDLVDLYRRVDTACPGERAIERDFRRITREYLPLIFSRRHGDPSRPWNRFSIELRREDGSRSISYQGNWRDIFQNWEALSLSYPRFLEGIITKFLNASTADGYNPYRISQDGIDWELFDPEDPWSNIGYWGDHQIVYLYRLMKHLHDHDPEALPQSLRRRRYVFADVPYRIKGFDQIVANPRDTIDFDAESHNRSKIRTASIGADGKLLHRGEERVYASLMEKLLITSLTKLSNLVPGGGIWMNTQRPEWNDANNALVGWGMSMVTVAYLRRFLDFIDSVLALDREGDSPVTVSSSIADFFRRVAEVLAGAVELSPETDEAGRYTFLESLGRAGERYRTDLYESRFGTEDDSLSIDDIRSFLSQAVLVLDRSLRASRRNDGLYHSYNLLEIDHRDATVAVSPLPLMLEGQVAVIASGFLSPREVPAVVDALYESDLYRPDQESFTLYPDKDLPSFFDKNIIPVDSAQRNEMLSRLVAATGTAIVQRDNGSTYHFAPDLRNAAILASKIEAFALPEDLASDVLSLYEEVFVHRTFTGRSGTFFKYEGLGSIYWHMVSKLLLGVAETYDQSPSDRLSTLFHRIREGIGLHKNAQEYGAYPTDPYSHTPAFTGVQQPGMTGQVKEDIISRFVELGVQVREGKVHLRPSLLRKSEFKSKPSSHRFLTGDGLWQTIDLPKGSLAFTYCGVPIVYRLSDQGGAVITDSTGTEERIPWNRGVTLSRQMSDQMFYCKGQIIRIDVDIPREIVK